MKKFLFSEIPQFLKPKERHAIRDKVYEMRDDWKLIGDYSRYSGYDVPENQYLLGDAIYTLEPSDYESINYELRSRLQKEFKVLYNRLFDALPKHFGSDIRGIKFFDDLPIPGFHVFHGKNEEEDPFQYHTDVSLAQWLDEINPNRIYSFTSLIEQPETGASLEWIGSLGKENVMPYELNKLHLWHGILQHRIGRHKLKEGESRITFQGHVYIDYEMVMHVFF